MLSRRPNVIDVPSDAIPTAAAGLALGLSLIVAIGAQNAFVLRQGLRREHIGWVIMICATSDAALIALGVAGAGALFAAVPWLVEVARWAGAAFLVLYAALAARRAIHPQTLRTSAERPAAGLASAIGTCLALTWLNPHVYLDTVVLVGSFAGTHGPARWAFGAGAALASVLWFTALGLGARLLAPVFGRPAAWRVLDAVIAAVMLGVAAMLVAPMLRGTS
jgi:L-lysine exporter family protein LysE/ArgO